MARKSKRPGFNAHDRSILYLLDMLVRLHAVKDSGWVFNLRRSATSLRNATDLIFYRGYHT